MKKNITGALGYIELSYVNFTQVLAGNMRWSLLIIGLFQKINEFKINLQADILNLNEIKIFIQEAEM